MSRIVPAWQRFTLAATTVLLVAAGSSVPRADFPPEKFENLKVLPGDIEFNDLLDRMKAFSQSLGVRCWFCHVGQEGQPLSEFNFVTDEKAHKQAARVMMRMTAEINGKFLPEVAGHDDDDGPATVTCLTCHRGNSHPEK